MVSLHCPHHTSWARMACWMGHSATGPPAPACHDRSRGAPTLPSLVTFFVCPQVPPLHCCVSDLLRGKTCH